MNRPTQKEMEFNMMAGKGQLGIKRNVAHAIPKQSQSATRTGNANSHDVGKKIKKYMQKKGMIK